MNNQEWIEWRDSKEREAIEHMERVAATMHSMADKIDAEVRRAKDEPGEIAYRARNIQDAVLWNAWNTGLSNMMQFAFEAVRAQDRFMSAMMEEKVAP